MLEDERLAKLGQMIKGRQILWMIHEYHKMDAELGALYDIQDLLSVKFRGDDQLEWFYTTWKSVIQNLNEPLSENIQESIFLTQLRESRALKDEIAHYDRVDVDHPDRSYKFLKRTVRKYINRVRKEKNRRARERGLAGDYRG